MHEPGSRLRAVRAASLPALLAAGPLAPPPLADVAGGGDATGGAVLFWLTVIACVGVVVGTAIFYIFRRRRD